MNSDWRKEQSAKVQLSNRKASYSGTNMVSITTLDNIKSVFCS